MPATGIRTSSSATCGSPGRTPRGHDGHGGPGSGRDGHGVRRRSRRRPAARCPAGGPGGPGAALLLAVLAVLRAALCWPWRLPPLRAGPAGSPRCRGAAARCGRTVAPAVAVPAAVAAVPAVPAALRPPPSPVVCVCRGRASAFGSLFASAVTVSGLPASAVARRRRRSAGAPRRWPAGRGSRSAAGPRPSRRGPRRLDGRLLLGGGRGVLARAGLGGGAALRLGLGGVPGGGAAALGPPPPACASLMTSISWLLRIRAVPLMPRPDATCCSSASTMPSRPVPRRRREPAPVAGAEASVEGAAAVSSTRAPIRSVVSLTKGPSLERTSACLARRPVVLSGFGPS